MFFAVAGHRLTVVAIDARYTKPLRGEPQCLNNINFESPAIDILDAYYYDIGRGVYEEDFPNKPAIFVDLTAGDNAGLGLTRRGTKVKVLEYGTVVEVVFQDIFDENHPMHLHSFAFYVVGRGFGNFDERKDSANYNLVDPPYQNTVSVPKGGWAAIRFRADNTGELSGFYIVITLCLHI
uniref:Plastocyanin-like domain-containing protein n=1 Tax=Leersia perrieri TaxID=77586 RepID=A0A0D9WVY1_9ORYZ